MDKQELTEEQEESYRDMLKQGSAFEAMMMGEGGTQIKAYYQARLTLFINDVFNQEDKPLSEFEGARRELLGLKRLLGTIENSIKVLHDERNKAKGSTSIE